MANRNFNQGNNLFQHYTPRENKHFQKELKKSGKQEEYVQQPVYMGKKASDYKDKPKSTHHISRKLFAIIISIAVVVGALVILGATASYHRDAPSTTTPETSQSQNQRGTNQNKKRVVHHLHKVHKIKRHIVKKEPKDNVVQVMQDKGVDEKPKTSSKVKRTSPKSTKINKVHQNINNNKKNIRHSSTPNHKLTRQITNNNNNNNNNSKSTRTTTNQKSISIKNR